MNGRRDSESWTRARTAGNGGEFLMARWWEVRGFSAGIRVGDASVDLIVQTTMEVKADQAASRTGHLAVEVGFRGKPSGIATSTADWWAFVLSDGSAVVMPTAAVRQYADRFRENRKTGGDNNLAMLHLVPLSVLRDDARVEFVNLTHLMM